MSRHGMNLKTAVESAGHAESLVAQGFQRFSVNRRAVEPWFEFLHMQQRVKRANWGQLSFLG